MPPSPYCSWEEKQVWLPRLLKTFQMPMSYFVSWHSYYRHIPHSCTYILFFCFHHSELEPRVIFPRSVALIVLIPNNVTIVALWCRHSRRQPQCLQERLCDRLNGTMNGALSSGLVSEVQPWRHTHTHSSVTSIHLLDTLGRVKKQCMCFTQIVLKAHWLYMEIDVTAPRKQS